MPPELARTHTTIDGPPALKLETSPMARRLETEVRDPLVAVMQGCLAGMSRPDMVNALKNRYVFTITDSHPDGARTSLNVHALCVRDDVGNVIGIDPEGVVSISAFVGTEANDSLTQVVYKGPFGNNPEPTGRIRDGRQGTDIRTTGDPNPEAVLEAMVGVTDEFLAYYR